MNPNEVVDGGVDERLRCYACGEVHESARIATTVDGRQMGSHSEEWRVYCEASFVLKRFRTKNTRRGYLQRITEIRGEKAVEILKTEMLRIWAYKQEHKK
jgi:hypothetical protein